MEIERNVIEQEKRNVISGYLDAKDDREEVAAWRLDLDRILRAVNVRSVA